MFLQPTPPVGSSARRPEGAATPYRSQHGRGRGPVGRWSPRGKLATGIQPGYTASLTESLLAFGELIPTNVPFWRCYAAKMDECRTGSRAPGRQRAPRVGG